MPPREPKGLDAVLQQREVEDQAFLEVFATKNGQAVLAALNQHALATGLPEGKTAGRLEMVAFILQRQMRAKAARKE